jgi:hypothetical protein
VKLDLKPQIKPFCEGQLAIPRLEHLIVTIFAIGMANGTAND